MDFQYFPNFIFPTALLIMILYLESWKTLNLVLGFKNLKWMFLHFSAFILLSFGLANIDIVDYKAFDELKLKNNPTYSLPKSKYSDKNDYRYRAVSLKLSLSDEEKLIIFTEDKRRITLSEVANEIINYRSTIREEQIPFLGVRIYANKELDLIYIKELEAELYLINQQRIIYEIYNEDAYSRKFEHKGISRLISNDILKFRNTEHSVSKDNVPLPPMAPFSFKEQKIEDTLNVYVAEEIFLENISVSKYELTDELKKHVKPGTLIQYNYFEKTKYQDYIDVLSSHFQAVNDLRQDASGGFDISKQTYLYSKEERIKFNQLKIQYPIIIQEILIKTPYPKTP